MREPGVRMLADVGLNWLPFALLIAYLFTLSANREEGLQNLDLGERLLQSDAGRVLSIHELAHARNGKSNGKERHQPDARVPDSKSVCGECFSCQVIGQEPDSGTQYGNGHRRAKP